MQPKFRLTALLSMALLISFTACKKNTTDATDNSAELKAHADDQNQVSAQFDALSNEATLAIESSPALSGRLQSPPFVICDAAVTFDSVSNTRTITITYDGSVLCHAGWKRTGVVVLSMPQGVQWKNTGATITATYQNVKITRIIDNKSITINGSHNLTNVSGGLLYNLSAQQTITHTLSSNGMSIKFDNNTERTWQVARKHVFSYNNGIVATITGNHTEGNNTGIAEWGLNRFGNAFTTSITQPLIIRQDCSFRLTAGEIKHEGFGTATATFGLNASGNPTSCPGLGLYFLKLSWTGPGGNTYSVILPY
ncbi:MAG: hypothetical protein WCF67_10245 [Chitinophagaceae bacterium]